MPKADLTQLIPSGLVDSSLVIHSLENWMKGEQIGSGKYGDVYKYKTPIANFSQVAGKHLKINLFNLDEEREKAVKEKLYAFVSELNLLHKISSGYSERIVQYVGCFYNSEKIILFTEFLPHDSIKSQIVNNPLQEAVALKYFYQTAQGLHYLHHLQPNRIVHKDIKCDNLLLTENDDVKLADFGLAHYLAVDSESNTLSMETDSVGTTLFMAPEVIVEHRNGRGADVWSLACTLVEMLTQHAPHYDFWKNHKERAYYLFISKASAEPENQLKYSGHLAPMASESIRKLLNCLFIKDKRHRPTIDDVLGLFAATGNTDSVIIDPRNLNGLESKIRSMST